MHFIGGLLRQLGMVALIMACALGGTVGTLALIRRFVPGIRFPQDSLRKDPGENQEER